MNLKELNILTTNCIKDLSLIILVFALLSSCIGKNNAPKETLFSGYIEVAVDETLVPIINEEIDVFEAMYPMATIEAKSVSEVDAIHLLLHDSIRLAVMARPFTEEEITYLNSKKLFPQSIIMAKDGIAFIINKGNKDSIISSKEIKRILNGDALKWNDVFPKSSLGKFSIAYDNRNSSTVRYVQDSIIFGKELAEASFAAGSCEAVVNYVKKTPNAIGIIGVNWISSEYDSITREFLSDVQVMRIDGYQPYQYYLYTQQYPFIRAVYLNINDPFGGLPTGFVNFITSARGQRIILKSGLLPATMPVNIVNIRDEW